MLHVFNSKSNQLELFEPHHQTKVSMYVCGPTVYNYSHIGNARVPVFYDVVRRYLEYSGFEVDYVSNITDIDDKIIATAQKMGIDETAVAGMFADAYLQDVAKLGSEIPTIIRVTDVIADIVEYIKNLVDTGYAYAVDGDVYFRVNKIEEYGQISGQRIDQLVAGSRVEESDKKEHPLDFTLWKATDTGVNWESPWSKGRPGWHTECVVMIDKHFQESIDIHGGGMDLKFPHHENEAAQNYACHHKPLARYWMHNGFIEMNDEKMSKSVGNIILAREAIAEYGGRAVRIWILGSHYRQPLQFTEEALVSSQKNIERLQTGYESAYTLLQLANRTIAEHITSPEVQAILDDFETAMDDDFNTGNALSALYELNKQLNVLLRNKEADLDLVSEYARVFFVIDQVLGLHVTHNEAWSPEIFQLVADWKQAREDKNFELADQLRDQLLAQGVRIR